MKIITLSSKDTFGGAAKTAYRLYKQLLLNNINDVLIVNTKRSKDPAVIIASDLKKKRNIILNIISHLNLKWKEKKRIKKWDVYLSTRLDRVCMDQEISLIGNILDNQSFDILHLQWIGESFVNFTEFKNITQPVVWTLHDCFPFTGICTHFEDCDKYKKHCGACFQLGSNSFKDFSYSVFEQKRERYKNINFHIVCPSNWIAKHAKESTLLGTYPIYVIPNGIDTDFFYPISKSDAKLALGLNPNKKIILFGAVGIDKDSRKGGRLVKEALDKLMKFGREDADIELLIFGADSLDYVFKYSATFLGYIDNEKFMRIVYSAADVVIVPSMYENLPTIIMESMSCGTPVAAFDIGGNSDMIEHKINGYLAKAYDTEDLAKGILFCLDDKSNILKNNAREKILKNFKIDDVAKQYINLYKSIYNN